jgi:hypothetical protein
MDPTIDHRKEFEAAWADTARTRITLPPVDVNRVLAQRYETDRPLRFTRDMLWDVEVRKARQPDRYIPWVVQSGSARRWAEQTHDDGTETFVRCSLQRLWLRPDERGLVLEQTHLDHASQRVTFVGAAELAGPEGEPLHADPRQALFHVEHAVAGEPDRPLNLWRIVHLTERPDQRLVEVFARIAADLWLPEFVEIYIRDDLGVALRRAAGEVNSS